LSEKEKFGSTRDGIGKGVTRKYKSIHGLFGVNNESHPIRCSLESLRSLEVVHLIEGEK
jgi:hypothetical protein